MVEKGKKKSITLYLDEYLIEDLRGRNYNISLLCNETLRTYVETGYEDVEYATKIMAVNELIDERQKAVIQAELVLQRKRDEYNSMVQRKNELEVEHAETERIIKVSRLLKELNKIIISSKYDILQVSEAGRELIDRIVELSPQFNLDTHVARLKRVMIS